MMFCDACGAQLSANQAFCSTCGKPVRAGVASPGASAPAVSVTAAQPRMLQHARVIGILWVIYSALHLLPGLFLIGFSHAMRGFVADIPFFVPGILHLVGLALSAVSILGLIAGWGLLSWKPWARTLTIVVSVLHLINFPLGTALGVYSLWVLLPAESEQHYRQQASVAQRSY